MAPDSGPGKKSQKLDRRSLFIVCTALMMHLSEKNAPELFVKFEKLLTDLCPIWKMCFFLYRALMHFVTSVPQ